jgi:hypothetical protein
MADCQRRLHIIKVWVDNVSYHCSYHVPEIRIVTCEPLRVGKEGQLIIKLCNPSQHQTTIQLLPLPSAEEDLEEREKEIEEKKRQAEKKDVEVSAKTSQSRRMPTVPGYTVKPLSIVPG